ncbi:MAG: methyltransferase domain-containing protein [Magnetococcales bacterium]|nr:methyltransferase domain-containing protein [Magnetococcales bacterium]
MSRSRKVAQAFGAAAERYDSRAEAQGIAALGLARRIAALPWPDAPRILEIGCGSGLVSRQLLRLFPKGHFLLTDRSPEMIRVARYDLSIRTDRLHFAIMDGERPALTGERFDLIVSGLTWQWFADPVGSFERMRDLLRPGGWLMISTLGEETFGAWRELCDRVGVTHGMPVYPSRSDWERVLVPPGAVEVEWCSVAHDSALDFLRSLRHIGAHQPVAGHRPVAPGALRRVLRLQSERFIARYQLLYLSCPGHHGGPGAIIAPGGGLEATPPE